MEKPGLTLPLPTGLSSASRIRDRDEAKNGLEKKIYYKILFNKKNKRRYDLFNLCNKNVFLLISAIKMFFTALHEKLKKSWKTTSFLNFGYRYQVFSKRALWKGCSTIILNNLRERYCWYYIMKHTVPNGKLKIRQNKTNLSVWPSKVTNRHSGWVKYNPT